METQDDRPAPKKSDQLPQVPADEVQEPPGQGQAAAAAARSYECIFCKRGFSNAQALGGHMNIHRKDKVKLKQAATSAASKEITSKFLVDKATPNMLAPLELKKSASSTARNWNFTSRDDRAIPEKESHEGELRQLPLFAETASRMAEDQSSSFPDVASAEKEPSAQELDLELSRDHRSTPSRRHADSAEDAHVNVTSATPESEVRPRRNHSPTSTLKNGDLRHRLNRRLFKTPHAELTKEIHELKDVVNTLQQKLNMAVAPPSTHNSHLDPGDLHLRLTSRSSYGRKYQSTADPTYNPKDKSGDHITRSGSCYRRDSSVEDSTNSSPAQGARVKTPRRSIHRKRTPESRSQERDSWKVVPRYHSPERFRPRNESGYPLSKAIEKAKLPPNFRMPQCDLYDGTGDPGEHVYQFQTNMLLLQVSDVVMCRAFPTTLRKAAHAWFKSLQPRSIYSFGQLSDLFQKHFVSSRSRRKNSASLLNIVQEKNESLACFLGRFNAATLEIDNLDESMKYTAFLRGLRPTSKFAFSVNKSPPGNMKALLKKANKYIQAEEYLETHKERRGERKEEQKKRSRELTRPQGGKPTKHSKYNERRPKEPFAWENLTPINAKPSQILHEIKENRLSSGRTS
ncbi:hypothetical protein RJ639_019083 [Escallonia herrerae]|uniref:C2H2-type domain-containing protein n=1 Tax=Escallonia herrerae TaxID=1293975 RepID=A0AA88V829_9ASTE|nr:hypothetical protein RJ639_019083 [Escallonia herrerae]